MRETDVLTEEHLAEWPEVLNTPKATKGETVDQVIATEVDSYRYWCSLEGLSIPTREAVYKHLKSMRS